MTLSGWLFRNIFMTSSNKTCNVFPKSFCLWAIPSCFCYQFSNLFVVFVFVFIFTVCCVCCPFHIYSLLCLFFFSYLQFIVFVFLFIFIVCCVCFSLHIYSFIRLSIFPRDNGECKQAWQDAIKLASFHTCNSRVN